MKLFVVVTAIFTLSLTTMFDKDFDYDKAWKLVEKYIKEGLPKSALEKVDEIYSIAKKEKNTNQQVKSTIYRTSLVLNTEELGLETVIATLNDRIKNSKSPEKNILQSMGAELIYQYYNQNYWKFSQRTDLGEQTDDIRTWAPNNYRQYITKMYLESLDGDIRKVKSEDFKELISNAKEADFSMRPSLYYLLVDRAQTYFSSNFLDSNDALNRFTIKGKEYLGEGMAFANMKVDASNEDALNYKLVRLYQNLLTESSKSGSDKLFATYDVARLMAMRNLMKETKKDEWYLTTLQEGEKKYKVASAKEVYGLQLMNYYQGIDKKKALEQAEKILGYGTEAGKAQAENCILQINNPSFSLKGREVYSTSENIAFRVHSENIGKLDFKIVEVDLDDFVKLRSYKIKKDYLKKKKALRSWSADINSGIENETSDLSTGSLNKGSYALIAENDKGAFYAYTFWVSDIAWSYLNKPEAPELIIRNRISGAPIQGAVVHKYSTQWNSGVEMRIPIGTHTSDRDGKVVLNGSNGTSFNYYVTYGNDKLDLRSSAYINDYYSDHKQSVIEVYTDRALYRPGQRVHYKGIAMSFDKDDYPHLIRKGKIEVTLFNANGQKVSSQKAELNDYGSISGTFTLPTGELTGSFRIEAYGEGASGRRQITVEEYKRPKYEVTFDESQKTFKLDEEVEVSGMATYYTGAAVSEATVSYQVYRQAFPIWLGYYFGGFTAESIMMAEGHTVTDDAGKFDISFIAESEGDVQRFNYVIEATVTDKNGESHDKSKTIVISSLPYAYTVEDLTDFDVSDKKKIKIFSKNHEGQNIASKAILKVIQLEEVESDLYTPFRPEKSDDEEPKGKTVMEMEIDLGEKGKEVSLESLEAGSYRLEIASKESYGDKKVEWKDSFLVTDFKKGKFPKNQILYTRGLKKSYDAGDKLKLELGTSDPTVMVYYYIFRGDKTLKEGWLDVDAKNEIKYTITKDDYGGLSIRYDFVKNNAYGSYLRSVSIPWDHMELDLKLETVKDVTLPGAEEKWKLIISNKDGSPVDAELLATMYDASLDQIKSHSWYINPFAQNYSRYNLYGIGFGEAHANQYNYQWNSIDYKDVNTKPYPVLDGIRIPHYYGVRHMERSYAMDGVMVMKSAAPRAADAGVMNEVIVENSVSEESVEISKEDDSMKEQESSVRENLDELVFFYPHVNVNKDGSAEIEFTMNDALTTWKMMALAHDKDLRFGTSEHEVKTQKDVMVLPNGPRFFREGDRIVYPATIFNLSDRNLTVNTGIEFKALSDERDLNTSFKVSEGQRIELAPGASQVVTWSIDVPASFKDAVSVKVWADAGKHKDAQIDILPVVTNQKLLTESDVVSLRKGTSERVDLSQFDKGSATVVPHNLVIEYTSNPVWYAVQALPSMIESNDRNIITIFNKYFGHELAAHIASENPEIKKVVKQWELNDSDALRSNLEKNTELKYAALKETPWVRNAQNETERKKRISLLFDENYNSNIRRNTITKLQNRQNSDGGFSWYPGGRSDVYTTQYIIEGLGHLSRMGIKYDRTLDNLVNRALIYMDRESQDRYDRLVEMIDKHGGDLSDDHLDQLSIHYLYTRRYFDQPIDKKFQKAYDYYFGQSEKYWLGKGLQSEAMIGLVLNDKKNKVADDIEASLNERSFYSEELGRYWNQGNGYHWYDLPIETHSMMIEFFNDRGKDAKFIEDAKIWLLKNKQTNDWRTPKATATAIYALLVDHGKAASGEWLKDTTPPTILVDGKKLDLSESELGTGYVKFSYDSEELKNIQSIEFKNNGKTIGWGSVYYQYFENLDAIKSHRDNPLNIRKTLYVKVTDGTGTSLKKVHEGDKLNVGDEVVSRIEIVSDRSMNYVHLEDMRPSGFEPINSLSGYRYKGEFGYYESPRDLSTNFFISYLPKGTHVFEYSNRVVHKGNYSTGIATIQNMYAPEFTSHSDGVRVNVNEK